MSIINFEDSEENYVLNSINITSYVRAPGEYKYYYKGENTSEIDKSFFAFSTMWYNSKITSDLELLSSNYNSNYTAQLYLNKTKKIYNIYIYKNEIDFRSENLNFKLIRILDFPLSKYFDISTYDSSKIITTIFFASDYYLIINDIDIRIILLDFRNGNYVSIFEKSNEQFERLYNIIDTYDEIFLKENNTFIRTYVFISIKNKEKKVIQFSYNYLIIQRETLIKKDFTLYHLDFDLGNAQPIGLKIVKIPKYSNQDKKWFYIICFYTSQIIFQMITDYENFTLHELFKKYSKSLYINSEKEIIKKLFFINIIGVEQDKKQIAQSYKIFLHININKLCSFILFLEDGVIISKNFNFNDNPKDIKNKIFLLNNIKLEQSEIHIDYKDWDNYDFPDKYIFKQKTICAFSNRNLVFAGKNKIYIYDPITKKPCFSYEFYEENLNLFLMFDGIASLFLLTNNKLFKIIFNQRFSQFNNIDFEKLKIYQTPKNLPFPTFDYYPEDIWNIYENKLNFLITKDNNIKMKHEFIFDKKNKLFGNCEVCSRETNLRCSECNCKFYCCSEHYKYDYITFHFFECQFIKFFRRNDIMNNNNNEEKYIILYNELIKLYNKILNFIFSRIFTNKDYQFFLQFIVVMIDIMENFGFRKNLEEYPYYNFVHFNDRPKQRIEKNLFFVESLFFYLQLNFLKCNFTLKSGLYNLTDCYLKIIKNELLPKLTPKNNRRLLILKFDKMKRDNIVCYNYFSFLNTNLFFNFDSFYNKNDEIDIGEIYLLKHLYILSLPVKFKIKINSLIEVKETFVDIALMFENHFSENKFINNNLPHYCYFSISYYLIETGKIIQTIKLLSRLVKSFNDNTDKQLKAFSLFDLGLLQYAIGAFKIGIHNLECSYKTIVENNLSTKNLLIVLDSLALAYLNIRMLFKSYVLIQTSINERKKIKMKDNEIKCIKLNIYLNYIIDLYEYSFITKTRLQIKKNNNNYDKHQLIKFVISDDDKELTSSELYLKEYLKVVHFIFTLPPDILNQLHQDNPSKTVKKEDFHYEKSISSNIDQSQNTSYMNKENNEKQQNVEEYDEDIEIKTNLYDLLSKHQQNVIKELKTSYLKRDIILRDSLGEIEPFNINYHPIYSEEFVKIIEKLRSNFLLKEIFYCFQTEKWRDELYNYNQNSCLFGLSKYLKLEKIKNLLAIESSKKFDFINRENQEVKKARHSLYKFRMSYMVNNIGKEMKNDNNEEKDNLLFKKKNKELSYFEFKKKFIKSLEEKEKDNNEFINYLNLNDDFLFSLYKDVYINNPEQNFIFENPFLILNYIYIELNKKDTNIQRSNDIIQLKEIKSKSVSSKYKNNAFKKSSSNKELNRRITDYNYEKKINSFSSIYDDLNESNSNESQEINTNIKKDSNNKIFDFNKYLQTKIYYDEIDDNLQICTQEEYSYLYLPFEFKKTRNKYENNKMEELLIHSFKNKISNSQNKSCENNSFINYSNISYLNNSNMKKSKIEIFQNVKNKNKSVEQQKSKKMNNSISQSKLSNKLNKNNSLSKNIQRQHYNINDIYYNIKKPNFYDFNGNIEINPYQLFNKKKNTKIQKVNIVNPFLISNRKKENKIDDDLTTINSSFSSITNNRNFSKDDFKNGELGRILLYNKKEKLQRESEIKMNKNNEYSYSKNNINKNLHKNYIYHKKSNNLSNEKTKPYIKKYIQSNSTNKEEENKNEILIKSSSQKKINKSQKKIINFISNENNKNKNISTSHYSSSNKSSIYNKSNESSNEKLINKKGRQYQNFIYDERKSDKHRSNSQSSSESINNDINYNNQNHFEINYKSETNEIEKKEQKKEIERLKHSLINSKTYQKIYSKKDLSECINDFIKNDNFSKIHSTISLKKDNKKINDLNLNEENENENKNNEMKYVKFLNKNINNDDKKKIKSPFFLNKIINEDLKEEKEITIFNNLSNDDKANKFVNIKKKNLFDSKIEEQKQNEIESYYFNQEEKKVREKMKLKKEEEGIIINDFDAKNSNQITNSSLGKKKHLHDSYDKESIEKYNNLINNNLINEKEIKKESESNEEEEESELEDEKIIPKENEISIIYNNTNNSKYISTKKNPDFMEISMSNTLSSNFNSKIDDIEINKEIKDKNYKKKHTNDKNINIPSNETKSINITSLDNNIFEINNNKQNEEEEEEESDTEEINKVNIQVNNQENKKDKNIIKKRNSKTKNSILLEIDKNINENISKGTIENEEIEEEEKKENDIKKTESNSLIKNSNIINGGKNIISENSMITENNISNDSLSEKTNEINNDKSINISNKNIKQIPKKENIIKEIINEVNIEFSPMKNLDNNKDENNINNENKNKKLIKNPSTEKYKNEVENLKKQVEDLQKQLEEQKQNTLTMNNSNQNNTFQNPLNEINQSQNNIISPIQTLNSNISSNPIINIPETQKNIISESNISNSQNLNISSSEIKINNPIIQNSNIPSSNISEENNKSNIPKPPNILQPNIPEINKEQEVSKVEPIKPVTIPNIPKVPLIPGISSIPGVPSIPKVPGIPGVPGVPGIPGIPGVPGVPGIPGIIGINNNLGINVKKKQKPTTQMKPLFWSTMNSKDIKNTLWESMDDEKIISKININKFEEEFSAKSKKPKPKEDTSKLKMKEKTILEIPRLQNISIVLVKIKRKPEEIANALLNYDLSILTEDLCELLLTILPKEEELMDLKAVKDISSYSKCDQFLNIICGVVGFKERLITIQIKYEFENKFNILCEKIDMLKNTLNKFTNDNRINDWLTIILAFGNYLNGQSMRGGAYGFKLDSLCKIVELKSNDNKITLLEFIIEWIYDNNDPNLLTVDLNYTKNASLKVTKEYLIDMKKSINIVKNLKEVTKNVDPEKDKSKEFLEFYDETMNKLNQKENELNDINNDYEKLVKSFGEKIQDMAFERFFSIFTSFFDNVKTTKEIVDRKRKMLARQKKKKS